VQHDSSQRSDPVLYCTVSTFLIEELFCKLVRHYKMPNITLVLVELTLRR
jgi:hypothetical protein